MTHWADSEPPAACSSPMGTDERSCPMLGRVKAPRPSIVAVDPRSLLANRTAETDLVAVDVGHSTLSLAVWLVARTIDVDPSEPPLVGDAIGIATVEVERSASSRFPVDVCCEVHGEVGRSVCKGVCLVM